MLSNMRITIVADTIVDEARIATYGAILDTATGELSMNARNIDNEACKAHKDVVRADRAEFEDFAYALHDQLKSSQTLPV